ncbi:MAG: hypothetical protein U9R39_11115 [Campylobacterota bacterium]|nr:hypothetical protein [Campylobacterota bacterium]
MNETSIGINTIAETMHNVAQNANQSGIESGNTLELSKQLSQLALNLSEVLESVK